MDTQYSPSEEVISVKRGAITHISLRSLEADLGSVGELLDTLRGVIRTAALDHECEVIVLSGATIGSRSQDESSADARSNGASTHSHDDLYRDIFGVLESVRPITVALVGDGYESSGDGRDLNLACDLVMSAESVNGESLKVKWAISPSDKGKAKLAKSAKRFKELEPEIFGVLASVA